jgi:polysaccharide biosynthesis transport protein
MTLNSSTNSNQQTISLEKDLVKLINHSNNGHSLEPAGTDSGDEFDLRQIFGILKRRSRIISTVTGVTAILISTWIIFQPAQYAGRFRLLIEPVTKASRLANTLTAADPSAQISQESYGVPYDPEYISQISVLKSQKLLEPVAKKLQATYPGISHEFLSAALNIKNPKDSKILEISYGSENPEEIKIVLSILAENYIIYSKEDRQRNLKQGLEFAEKQIQQQQQTVAKLEGQLQRFRQQNGLVEPTQEVTSLSTQMSNLTSQRRENRVRLSAAQTLYKRLQDQVGSTPNTGVAVTSLSESPTYQQLLNRLRESEVKLAAEMARFRADTPAVQNLIDQRNRLAALVQQEEQRNFRSNPNSGDVVAIQQPGFQGVVKRDLVKQLVDASNQTRVLESQDAAIGNAIQQVNSRIEDLADVSRGYDSIVRNLKSSTESLSRSIASRENLQLEYARQQTPWELMSTIDDSSISDVSGTSRKMMLGAFVSLLLGVGAALITEKLDRVYHTPDDLKEIGIPCIGLIPYYTKLKKEMVLKNASIHASEPDATNKQDVANHYQMVPFMEAFYSLDANIRLLGSDAPIRSLTISSTSPADGKSTVSAHLALAAAAMGRKVLLVDTDMRLPQVHRRFEVPNMRGLSNLLTSDVDIKNIIQPSSQDPNLHLLTAGPTPPSPGRLLSSKRMQNLIRTLANQYDLVIYDSPPLLGFADAKLSAAYTDGILLVVGLGKTDRTALKQVLDDLKSTVQAPVLGLVANGLKKGLDMHSNRYYYQKYYTQQNQKTGKKRKK